MAEPLNATFFAFRKREQSGVLLRASIGFAVGLILIFAVFAALLWQAFSPVIAWYGEMMAAGGDPAAMEGMTPPVGILWLVAAEIPFLFFVFVLLAAYEAACHRWMIRGETGGGLLGLNLGADTWRVYATYWVWFGLFIALYIACLVVFFGLIASLLGGGADPGVSGLIGFGAGVAIILALLYVCVRLAPAAATSVGRRRFAFFSAWTVSSGRFWALFGAFLLLFFINIVVSIVLSVLAFSVLFAGAFANLNMADAATDPNAFSQAYLEGLTQLFSSPTMIAMVAGYYLLAGAIGLLFYVLFYGVNSRAVQAALEEGKISAEPAD